MKQSTLNKMNNSLFAGMIFTNANEVVVKCFDHMVEFTNKHSTKEAQKFGLASRDEILNMFIEDMHSQIFNKGKNEIQI